MILKELFAKIGLDVDEIGFEKADTLIGGLKIGLAALGSVAGVAAAGLTSIVMATVEAADGIDETAQSAGVTTDALQELAYAASFSGMGIEEMSHALTILTRNMGAAAAGGEEQAKAFSSIGVAVTDGEGKLRDAGDVMQDIAEHFESMPDGADKTALAMKLFGKSGAGMIPFLNAGAEGMAKLSKEAHEFGMVLSEDVIKQGAEVDDTLTRIHAVVNGLKFSIAGPLLSTVKDLGTALIEWIKNNRELIRQRVDKVITLLKFAVGALLFVLDKLWIVLGFVIDNWKLLATILNSLVIAALVMNFNAISAALTGYIALGRAAVVAGLKSAAAWVAATWPFLLLAAVIAIVILLIEDVLTALDGGDSILGHWLGDDWVKTLRGWRDAFKDFWDWLAESSSKTWKDMKKGFDLVFGTNTSGDEGGKEGFSDDKGKGPGVWIRNNKGILRFYPWLVDSQPGFIPETNTTGFESDVGRGSGSWKRLENGLLRFFPDNTEDFSPTPASFGTSSEPDGGMSVQPTDGKSASFSVNQYIYGAPGQSPADVAGEATNQLDAWHQRQLEAAYSATG